ncbi:MAG: thiol-disulfide oxidoreductase DCC family protein [Solirubrobacterales bacterium]
MIDDRPIVLYDSDCGFCRWALARLLAWDRRRVIRPVAIGSAEGTRLLADLAPQKRDASWHFIDRDGSRTSAGAAASPMLRHLPGGRLPARLLARFPAATERLYGAIARHRGALGALLTDGAVRRADARIGGRS